MSDLNNVRGRDVGWWTMSPMEQAAWAMALVMHCQDDDGGLDAADVVIARLRALRVTRMHRPEPEYQAAQAKAFISRNDFMIWYPIQYRNEHAWDPDYRERTLSDAEEAYVRFEWNRANFS